MSEEDVVPPGSVRTQCGIILPASQCVTDYAGNVWPRDECVVLRTRYGEHSALRRHEGLLYALADDEHIVCCHDGAWRFMDECTEIGSRWHPSERTFCCDNCGENGLADDSYVTPSEEVYCQDCYYDNYRECDNCGRTYARDEHEECCSGCRSRLILPYSDKSSVDLPREHRGVDILGIELEVEATNCVASDGAKWVRETLDERYCVFKEDGSLGPGGFEIVTRPDSLAVHRRYWSALLSKEPGKRIRSWKSGRCGMHVHVNRRWLSHLQVGKMQVFLNSIENRKFVTMIAGRTDSEWAAFKHKKISDARRHDERYVALNAQQRTAEFRIFRGTVALGGFMKNLDFCHALVRFTSPAARSIREATDFREFVRWLDRKEYPHLFEFLCEKGYRQPPPPRKA